MKKASVMVVMLILNLGYVQAQTQTPGQIVKFDPALTDTDSVITEDASGNIGVGTGTPAARLDVAGGNVNHQNSTANAGNVLKGGVRFLHNFGTNNTFLGTNAGNLAMSGTTTTGIGVSSLAGNTTGNFNTAIGNNSLQNNNTGFSNTAAGVQALLSNADGFNNTANGVNALYSNTSGSYNTAAGIFALFHNTTGDQNTAVGASALDHSTTGRENTAAGVNALQSNTIGQANTASGADALQSNTSGGGNTASGFHALQQSNTGTFNTAVGSWALGRNDSGGYSTAVGKNALWSSKGSFNVAVGDNAIQNHIVGDDNIAIGSAAGVSLLNGYTNIYIGQLGPGGEPESNTIRIGRPVGHNRFFAAGVTGVPVGGTQVFVNSDGQLGVAASSRRFKEEVRDVGDATSRLRQLRPVSFYYKQDKQAAAKAPRQLHYGLVAEEVAAVYPELVEYSENGEPFSVRYHLLEPMLLNEVQHRDREIARQRQQIYEQAAQIAELKAQAAQISGLKAQLAAMGGRLEWLVRQDRSAAATRGTARAPWIRPDLVDLMDSVETASP